jgi:hypothetical protein
MITNQPATSTVYYITVTLTVFWRNTNFLRKQNGDCKSFLWDISCHCTAVTFYICSLSEGTWQCIFCSGEMGISVSNLVECLWLFKFQRNILIRVVSLQLSGCVAASSCWGLPASRKQVSQSCLRHSREDGGHKSFFRNVDSLPMYRTTQRHSYTNNEYFHRREVGTSHICKVSKLKRVMLFKLRYFFKSPFLET